MRRVLFYDDHDLVLSDWTGKGLQAVRRFNLATDLQGLVGQLTDRRSGPVDLVIDTAMESFRIETLPRLSRRDRRAAATSLLRRHYRDCELRQALQIEAPDGARLRLSGIADDPPLRSLIGQLAPTGVRVRHIHSAPMLVAALIRDADHQNRPALLLTPHGENAWRHSLFLHGQLLFSRIAGFDRPGQATEAHLAAGTAETLSYLQSRGLITKVEQVAIAVIGAAELHEQLSIWFQRQSLPAPRLLETDRLLDAFASLPSEPLRPAPGLSFGLLLSALALQVALPGSGYRSELLQHTHRMDRWRRSLWLASAACALTALVMFTEHAQRLDALAEDTAWLRKRVESAQTALSQLPAKTDALERRAKAVESQIDTARLLLSAAHRVDSQPLPALARLLTAQRHIAIDRLTWSLSGVGAVAQDRLTGQEPTTPPDTPATTLRMVGRVQHAATDLQGIDAGFRKFLAASRQLPGLRQTRVLRRPLTALRPGDARQQAHISSLPADLAGFEVEWILETGEDAPN